MDLSPEILSQKIDEKSKQELQKQVALESFEFFREFYLGHSSYEAQTRWVNAVEGNKLILTLCPGGHGKSMTAVDYITWLIVRNRFGEVLKAGIGELNVVIVSLSAELGTKWLRQIKLYLESPKIVADFGTFRNSEKWSQDAIIVLSPNNKAARVDHPTVQTLGIGGQVFGLRAHFIVADDVVDKENSGTDEQRKKLDETFQEGVRAWLRPGGKIWVIGTRMNSRDLYATFMKRGAYKTIVDKAVDFDTGVVLCPEEKQYSLAYFKQLKQEMGTASFNRRYMNVAYDEAEARYQEAWFPALYDENRPYGFVDPAWRISIGVDPAVGKGKGRSKIAMAVEGYDPKTPHIRYLIDYIADQLTPEQQADRFCLWYVNYKASLGRIEKNACQLYLRDYIIERAKKYGISPRIEMTFTGASKWDNKYGVDVVSAHFENASFRLPYSESAVEKTHKLRDMLIEADPDTPADIEMALWFNEQYYQSLAKRRVNRIELDKPPILQLIRSA